MAPSQPASPAVVAGTPALPPVMVLPLLAVSPVDIGRLICQLETIEEHVLQSRLRAATPTQPSTPTTIAVPTLTSRLLEEAARLNNLDLLQLTHRAALRQFLMSVKAHSPVLHVSFSADPDPAFLKKLMAWLRQEIHPDVLITIGLQPTIGAGCLLRTTNQYFDFSLRQRFADKREMLRTALQPAVTAATMPEASA